VGEGACRIEGYTLGAKGAKRKAVELATDPVAPQQSKLVVELCGRLRRLHHLIPLQETFSRSYAYRAVRCAVPEVPARKSGVIWIENISVQGLDIVVT
jgi:hypothetical protein